MPTIEKQHGIHYTPPELAEFLAQAILRHLPEPKSPVVALDPACGEGALLAALWKELPPSLRDTTQLKGYDSDSHAISLATATLADMGAQNSKIEKQDFLDLDGVELPLSPLVQPNENVAKLPRVDIVIANPPYVRTQVLGAKRSRQISQRFGLSGRVDLYHAFAIAMAHSLKPRGIMGLLTSNRFLTIKSGMALRRILETQFDLLSIYDLGDTKLFETAAVLPAIVIAQKLGEE